MIKKTVSLTAEGKKELEKELAALEQEKEDALREIRAQVAELSIAIAEKVIAKELDGDKENDAFMDALLDEAFDTQKNKQ